MEYYNFSFKKTLNSHKKFLKLLQFKTNYNIWWLNLKKV